MKLIGLVLLVALTAILVVGDEWNQRSGHSAIPLVSLSFCARSVEGQRWYVRTSATPDRQGRQGDRDCGWRSRRARGETSIPLVRLG